MLADLTLVADDWNLMLAKTICLLCALFDSSMPQKANKQKRNVCIARVGNRSKPLYGVCFAHDLSAHHASQDNKTLRMDTAHKWGQKQPKTIKKLYIFHDVGK